MKTCVKTLAYSSVVVLEIGGFTWRVQIVIAGSVKIAAGAWARGGHLGQHWVAINFLWTDALWTSLRSQATKDWRRSSKTKVDGVRRGESYIMPLRGDSQNSNT